MTIFGAFAFSYALAVVVGFVTQAVIYPIFGEVGNWNLLNVGLWWLLIFPLALRVLD